MTTKIGIISDSYNVNNTALVVPAAILIEGKGAGSTDEGQALAWIAKREDPNASFSFAGWDRTQPLTNLDAQLANDIYTLAMSGCRVIVDDISFSPETQSSLTWQAITTVTNAGCTYVSAAGNSQVTVHATNPAAIDIGAHNVASTAPESYSPSSPAVDYLASDGITLPSKWYGQTFNGTSCAAGDAAGVVAEMIDINPNLVDSTIKWLLNVSSDSPQLFLTATPSDQCGFGNINAARATALAVRLPGQTTGINGEVERIYQACSSRVADASGLAYWSSVMAGGASTAAVCNYFTQGAEFTGRYGNPDPATLVRVMYHNVLGRNADAGGLSYWSNLIASGVSKGTVMGAFVDSPEFIADFQAVHGYS